MTSCLLKSPVLSLKSHSADFLSISRSCSIAQIPPTQPTFEIVSRSQTISAYILPARDTVRETIRSRGKIEGLYQTGLSHREIARLVGKFRGAVQKCVKRWEEGSNDYIKRSGRKRSTSAREDRLLERLALTDRKATTRRL